MAIATSPYREQAHKFWQQAQEELEKGDLRQASEKGWGAAAQMVKAVAEHQGLEHQAHKHLFAVVSGLDNQQHHTDFGLAGQLHTNFYEGWLNQTLVREYLDAVGVFINALEETELVKKV